MALRDRATLPGSLGRVRPALRSAFLDNIGFKILSIIFAFATWAWVQGERVVEQKARVDLAWVFPDGLALVDEVPRNLILTVSGSQVFVRNVRHADLKLHLDLSEVSAGVQRVDFEDRAIENLPANVRVLSVSPSSVEFELDEKIRKRVSVEPEVAGQPAEGHRLVEVVVEPDAVELEGPRRVLAGVTQVPTEAIDISGARKDREEEVSLGRLPRHVESVTGVPLRVSVDVEPINTTVELEGVHVLMMDRAWEPVTDTVQVVLEGPVADLESIKAEDVAVMVHVDEGVEPRPLKASKGSGTPARYRVVYPFTDRVAVTRVRPETIEIRPR